MNPAVFWQPSIVIGLIQVQVTKAINEVLSEEMIGNVIANAEQARQNRGIEIRLDQMYMIRFTVPPSDRKIVVMFVWVEGETRGMVAYYDEVEDLLKGAGTDYKKLTGSPL